MRDAQALSCYSRFETESDNTRLDPTELPQLHNASLHLFDVEVREMLLQRLNIILTASATLDVSGFMPQTPRLLSRATCRKTQAFAIRSFLFVILLLQVAAQDAKDSVNCSGVLRSTPVPVNGKRYHNPVLYLSQLVSGKKTVPVVKIGELQQPPQPFFPDMSKS